jgi:DHA2 family multidrug resistance protein
MALNEEITRQASMIAYINDFKLMMIVTLISLPFVLLLSSPKKLGGSQSKEAVVMD